MISGAKSTSPQEMTPKPCIRVDQEPRISPASSRAIFSYIHGSQAFQTESSRIQMM